MSVRVITPITALSVVYSPVVGLNAYDASADAVVDLRGMRDKVVVVKETGGSSGITYTILGSVDDGASYDLTVKSDTAISAGSLATFRTTDYYTHWTIRAKATSGGVYGTSTSDASPSTSILAGNIKVNLDGDGDQAVALDVHVTGAAIAADIQAKVRALTAVTAENQAAYAGFTAVYGTAYVLSSGTTGASSSVVVTDGASTDRAAELKIGVANGGTEVAGNADAVAVVKLASISI